MAMRMKRIYRVRFYDKATGNLWMQLCADTIKEAGDIVDHYNIHSRHPYVEPWGGISICPTMTPDFEATSVWGEV